MPLIEYMRHEGKSQESIPHRIAWDAFTILLADQDMSNA